MLRKLLFLIPMAVMWGFFWLADKMEFSEPAWYHPPFMITCVMIFVFTLAFALIKND